MPALSSPTIVVNGDVIAIKPNTFKYTEGRGERLVRPQSTGGGAVTQVITDNVETKRSKCSFTVLTTSEIVEKIRTWQDNGAANSVQVSDRGDFSRNFENAIIINDIDLNLGADQDVEVAFESKPAV